MRAGPPPVHCVVAVMGGWGWGRDTYEYGWVAHALHATRNKRTCTVAANPSVASSRRCSWPTPDMTMAEVAGSTAASACCSDVNENGAAGGDGGASENDTGSGLPLLRLVDRAAIFSHVSTKMPRLQPVLQAPN